MLTKEQMEEIRMHLDKAQNPVFLYDNDADGLCSFVLIRRFIGRGKGVAVRSYPNLDKSYASRAAELNADYVFVLDKPVISKEFFDEVQSMNLPFVWIDHHDIEHSDFEKYNNFHRYNPCYNKGKERSSEPTTYLIYETLGKKKEDMWIAIMGCIADHYMPDFAEKFGKENPELWAKGIKEPFDVYYNTEIGRMAQALNFGLKDSTTNIVKMQNYIIACKSPGDFFAEVRENSSLRLKYGEIRKKYDALLEKAKSKVEDKLLFFEYGGELSISSDLSNELSYIFKGKYICIAYKKGEITNISLRGKKVKAILERVLKNFENASGGGHEDAVGARIRTSDLEKFKEFLVSEIN